MLLGALSYVNISVTNPPTGEPLLLVLSHEEIHTSSHIVKALGLPGWVFEASMLLPASVQKHTIRLIEVWRDPYVIHMSSQSIQLSLLLHILLPGFLTVRRAGWLWLHVLNVSGAEGWRTAALCRCPTFFPASGIHWVGVRLLDSAVASWLGRRGRQKVAAGYLRLVGV